MTKGARVRLRPQMRLALGPWCQGTVVRSIPDDSQGKIIVQDDTGMTWLWNAECWELTG